MEGPEEAFPILQAAVVRALRAVAGHAVEDLPLLGAGLVVVGLQEVHLQAEGQVEDLRGAAGLLVAVHRVEVREEEALLEAVRRVEDLAV